MTTQHEIRKVCDVSARIVTLTASESLTQHIHEGRTLLMGSAGSALTFTLPAATGSGATYKFVVSVVNTSNYIITCGSGLFYGQMLANSTSDAAVTQFTIMSYLPDLSNDIIFTLNGTTTGGVRVGDYVTVQDIASDTWWIDGLITQSGTEATPFS